MRLYRPDIGAVEYKYEIENGVLDQDVATIPLTDENNYTVWCVKNKKDIHQGLNAYFKLNAQAFKVGAPGALIVSCTCSGLVGLEDFKESLRKSIARSGKNARCVVFGGQGWDHPTLMSFPEGYYLKMVMHQLD